MNQILQGLIGDRSHLEPFNRQQALLDITDLLLHTQLHLWQEVFFQLIGE
jgi:hypothetical protein